MMKMSVSPARTASWTTSWIDGVSISGSISLGSGFGGRQEPGAETGGGDDGLPHLHGVTFMTDSIPRGRRVYA